MAKDNLGNDLKEGDICLFKPADIILGKVLSVKEGGLIGIPVSPKEQLIAPGEVQLYAEFTFNIDPRSGCAAGVFKVHQPTKPKVGN